MPKYKFDGFNKDGKKTSGEIMASNMTKLRKFFVEEVYVFEILRHQVF